MLSTLEQHVSALTRALAGQAQDERDITPAIKSSSKISPQLALSIYRNNTRGTRINALEAIYPVCRNILGEDTFRSIARAYVDADTVGTSDLNRYGKAFSQQMDSILDTGRLPEGYSYLADLARLEFMVHEACYADTDPEFDFKLFEQRVLNDERVGFQLSHSLGLLDSPYPIHEIWLNNRPELNKGPHSHDIRALTDTQYLLVYRDEYIPVVVPVKAREYHLLEAFANNHSLQDVVEHIDCDIDVMLPGLIANKWITGITAVQPAFLTRPLYNPSNRMIRKPEARFQSNTVCSVRRYFVPCTSVASLRTHLPSNHSYCYAFQSRRALRNTTDAPESEILVRNAG